MTVRKDEVKSIWEQQLNNVFTESKHTDMDMLLNILSIVMFGKFDERVGKLYSIVNDIDLFTKIVNTFSGLEIKIPERQDFKDAITLGLSYYYREIKKMKWEDIKKELPYEDNLPLKTGKGLVKLNKSIKDKLSEILDITVADNDGSIQDNNDNDDDGEY